MPVMLKTGAEWLGYRKIFLCLLVIMSVKHYDLRFEYISEKFPVKGFSDIFFDGCFTFHSLTVTTIPVFNFLGWLTIHFLDTFPLTFSIIASYRPTDRGTSSFFLALVPPAHSEQRLTTTARKKQIKVVYTICSLGVLTFHNF